MCYGTSYPNSLGWLIAGLSVGDEIIIHVKGQPDIVTYVWQQSGFSALTASGHELSCHMEFDIEATGNNNPDFEVSDVAKARLAQIEADIEIEESQGDDWMEEIANDGEGSFTQDIANDSDPLDLL